MNKIANAIGYMTIHEAIGYIAHKTREDVKESNIYQLALDNKLKLSIKFGHAGQSARKVTEVFNISEGMPFNPDQEGIEDFLCPYSDGEGNDTALLEQDPYGLSASYELTLWGSERYEIEKLRNKAMHGDSHEETQIGPQGGILVKTAEGDLFCLVKMERKQKKFKYVQMARFPESSFLIIRKEEIDRFIESNLDGDKESCLHQNSNEQIFSGESKASGEGFPVELQRAIDVYYEFWHEKPEETNPASEENVRRFLLKRKDDLSDQAIQRIITIARPEKAKKGGAPKSGYKEYKGKSQKN